ncbi:hypothetical protein M426DRAFT_192001 [Hypoxylon sp. CI-4A]|nr:hypothetical protein M426DRAFT_192001 [Hypoxylon sp. CI-4A]
MNSRVSAAAIEEAVEDRRRMMDQFMDTQPDPDRDQLRRQLENKAKDHLRDEEVFRKKIQDASSALEESSVRTRRLIDTLVAKKLTDDDNDDDELQRWKQDAFNHALLLVSTEEGNVDRIRNISAAHREALGVLESESVKKTLMSKIDELNKRIEEQTASAAEADKKMEDMQNTLQTVNTDLDTTREELRTTKESLEVSEQELNTVSGEIATSQILLVDEILRRRRELNERSQKQLEEIQEEEEEASDDRTLSENLDDYMRLVSSLDEERSGLADNVENLTTELEASSSKNQNLQGQVSSLEESNRNMRGEIKNLQEAAEDKNEDQEAVATRELDMAQFFADWIPFVHVALESSVTGKALTASERSWKLLQTWEKDRDQQPTSESLSASSSGSDGLTVVAGKLYGYALEGYCGEEVLHVLEHLLQLLEEEVLCRRRHNANRLCDGRARDVCGGTRTYGDERR